MPMQLKPVVASSISRTCSAISTPDIRIAEEDVPEKVEKADVRKKAPPVEDGESSDSHESEVDGAPFQLPLVPKTKKKKRKKHGGFSSSKAPAHTNPEDYEQKYPEDEHGYEMGPNARVWRTYLDEAETFDTNLVEAWKDDIDVLLTFAGLFSGVVTTFVAQTSQKFEVDQTEFVASLLHEVIGVQRAMSNAVPTDTIPITISPVPSASSYDLWTNGLWFTSLAFSLSTALGAVLAKQWLQHYNSTTSGTQQQRVRIRQFRYIGLRKWGVPVIIALLPILLHIAVFLFFVGLVVFLLPLNRTIAYVVAAIGGTVYGAYILSGILAAISLQCPYKTPFTLALHHAFTFFVDGIYAVGHTIRAGVHKSRKESPAWMQRLVQPAVTYWSRNHIKRFWKNFATTGSKPIWLEQFSKQWNKWRTRHTRRWPLDAEIRFVAARAHAEVLEAEAMRWLLTSSSNPTAHAIVAKALPARASGGMDSLHVQPEDTDIGRLLQNSQVRSRLLVAVTGAEKVDKKVHKKERRLPHFTWKRDQHVAERLFQACHQVNLIWQDTTAPIFSTVLSPRRITDHTSEIDDLSYADNARVETILSVFPNRSSITTYLTTCVNNKTRFASVVWTGLFEILSAVYFAHARKDAYDYGGELIEADNFTIRWNSLLPYLSLIPFPVRSGLAENQDSNSRVNNQLLPVALEEDIADHDICHAIMSSALLVFSLPENEGNKEGLALQLKTQAHKLKNLNKNDFHTGYGLISIAVWLHCICKLHELEPTNQDLALKVASSHLLHWCEYSKGHTWALVVTEELLQPVVREFVFSNHFLSHHWSPEAGGTTLALYFYLFHEGSDPRKELVDRLRASFPRYNLLPSLLYSVREVAAPEDRFSFSWREKTVHFANIEHQHMLKPVSEILCDWSPIQTAIRGNEAAMSDIGPYLAIFVEQDFLSAMLDHSSCATLVLKGRLSERAWERWVADGHAADWMAPSRELMSSILTLFTMAADDLMPLEDGQREKITTYFYTEGRIKTVCEILVATTFVTKWWLPGPRTYHVSRFDYSEQDLELIKELHRICPSNPAWKVWLEDLSKNLRDYYAFVLEGRRLDVGSKAVKDYNTLSMFAKDLAALVRLPIGSLDPYSPPPVTPISERFRHSYHSPPQSPVSPA